MSEAKVRGGELGCIGKCHAMEGRTNEVLPVVRHEAVELEEQGFTSGPHEVEGRTNGGSM